MAVTETNLHNRAIRGRGNNCFAQTNKILSSDLAGRVAKADMQGERGPNSLSLDIFRWDSVRCLAGDCPKILQGLLALMTRP